MSGLDFLDTNILVHAHDSAAQEKQKTAQNSLTKAVSQENGSVSTKVLGDFITVITCNVMKSLSNDEPLDRIEV